MDCKGAEKLILRFFDNLVGEKEKQKLKFHLKECPSCREKEKQYGSIFNTLKTDKILEPLSNFESRLMSKIRQRRSYEPWSLWRQWSVRLVPVSIGLIILLVITMVFFLPGRQYEISQTGDLLLYNTNPLIETTLLLEEKSVENKNMMLIFYASENNRSNRRNFQ